MDKLNLKSLGLVVMVLLATGVLASANLVNNGGFETGDFTGWTTDASGISTISPFSNSGNFAGSFSGIQTANVLTQNIATTAGATYDLSFFLTEFAGKIAQSGTMDPLGFTGFFRVFWGGVMIFDNGNPPINNYTQFSMAGLQATGASTELRFAFFAPAFFPFLLDDVVVNQVGGSSVPDNFSTLWLALPLIGMVGFSRLRRKELSSVCS